MATQGCGLTRTRPNRSNAITVTPKRVSIGLIEAWARELARLRDLLAAGGPPEDVWFWGMRREILEYVLTRYAPPADALRVGPADAAAPAGAPTPGEVRFAHLPSVLGQKKRAILGELREWNRQRYEHVAFETDAALREFRRRLIEYERS